MEVEIGIKPAPSDHESNFKKVGSIPCGFNNMGTRYLYSTNAVKMCSDSQSLSSLPSNLLVYVLRIVKM